MIKPAIVAVGYNRPDSMERLLKTVVQAYYPVDEIDLVISIDESDKSNEVEKIANNVEWKHGKKIIKRYPKRQGLRKHILQCGDLSQEYGAVIILEDDLVVSPSFYTYTFEAVNKYAENSKVAGVSLYSHAWNGYANTEFRPVKNEFDVYFGQYSITWGQCWTEKQWNKFKEWYLEHEDKLPDTNYAMPSAILRWSAQSWGKYFISFMVEQDLYYIMPYTALTTNFSEKGQHNSITDTSHQVSLQQGKKMNYNFPEWEEGIKYDVFFERIFEHNIAGIKADEICVNLNGMKLDNLGKKYVLTSNEKKEMKPVASFGLCMRPIDANIDFGIPGNDLYLYESTNIYKFNEHEMSQDRAIYETYQLSWKFLFKMAKVKLIDVIKLKAKRLLKR